jgi:hypothetical protein
MMPIVMGMAWTLTRAPVLLVVFIAMMLRAIPAIGMVVRPGLSAKGS